MPHGRRWTDVSGHGGTADRIDQTRQSDGVFFSAVALGVVILNVMAVVVAIILVVSYLIQRDYRKAALTALGTISGFVAFVAAVVGLTAIV